MRARSRVLTRTFAATAAVSLAVPAALAHPHVWVATRSQAIFEGGALTGLRFTWMFDEMYTQSATEGLDANKDGKLDESELAELIKVNVEGLKEFEYFTSITHGGQPVPIADPKNFTMEVVEVDEAPGPQLVAGPADAATSAPRPAERPGLWTRFSSWVGGWFGRSTPAATAPAPGQPAKAPEKTKVLTLEMTLPLKTPLTAAQLDASAKGFRFQTADTQMFIWFEPLQKDGISLSSGAPAGCRAVFVDPEMTEEQKKLAEAFGSRDAGMAVVGGGSKAGTVICAGP